MSRRSSKSIEEGLRPIGKLGDVGKTQRQLTEIELELAKIKRELVEIKMERVLLKKVATYFAKEVR